MFGRVEDKEPNGDRKSHVIIKNKQRYKYVRGQRQALHCASDLWGEANFAQARAVWCLAAKATGKAPFRQQPRAADLLKK